MLILGIDDAGRGPLIGPMVLAGVLINEKQESLFKKNKIRDSKQFTFNSHRVKFSTLIKKNSLAHKIVTSSPKEIDHALTTGTNLNTLEAIKTAEIINTLNPKKQKIEVIVDCPSNNVFAWRATLLKLIKHKENITLKCEHKADENHLSVAAASILAKVTREEEVAKLKKQFGELGSGYAADPITKEFLKARGKELRNEGIFRKTWATWKKMFPVKGQATLKEF